MHGGEGESEGGSEGTGGPPSPMISPASTPAFELTSHAAAERLLWLDMEMTNISDPSRGRIMEVGVVVTGPTAEWLVDEEERGVCVMYHRVLRLSEEELADSSHWSKMHHARRRGLGGPGGGGLSLMELCMASSFSLAEVESDLIAIVRFHGGGRPMMLAGSSVACDRVFIDRYMPGLASVLHHRTVDVSTILELSRRMYPGLRIPAPTQPPGTQHTAMGDILASLRLMHWFQNTVFMPGLLTKGGEFDSGGAPSPHAAASTSSLHPAYLGHQPHWRDPSPRPAASFTPAVPPRNFVIRRAPPIDGTPPIIRPTTFVQDPLIVATASYGFPLTRRASCR
jgi:oligoribonuclease